MRAVYFDCFSGISGDMMLGALIDLGISPEAFLAQLKKIPLSGYEVIIEKKESCGIVATDVQVVLTEEEHSHPHEDELHGRNLLEIEALIDESRVSSRVKGLSKQIFYQIAKAEAKVHAKDIYEIHFHEVGAVDSIIDIMGVCICLDLLGIEAVYSSVMRDGSGFVECEHGTLPVPVPAVMEMLKGSKIPLVMLDVNTELMTPTGIGILKTLSLGFGVMPKMYVEGVGYGLGKRNIGRLNALRAVIGTLFEEEVLDNEVNLIEANIDDLSPQILGFTMERLFEAGALDVFYTPIYMKKNRPSYKLSVISKIEDTPKMEEIIFLETTTIGIRKLKMDRVMMERDIRTAQTEFGMVRYKESRMDTFTKISVEYEDAREIALKTNRPLQEILESIQNKLKGLS